MKPISWCCAGCFVLLAGLLRFPVRKVAGFAPKPDTAPQYDKAGQFLLPANYREWVFLSAGIDMAYGPKGVAATGQSVFDNVFVDPEAYRYFLAKGTWPDKTVMVLEVRGAETNVSINHGGHSQGQVKAVEVHLKDASRFPGETWAFFDVKPTGTGALIAPAESCYSCHREHAAVDTTFVQFYPTLLPMAKEKGTLSPAYLKAVAAEDPAK